MDFNAIQIILVLIVAFLAGLEGILDAFPIPSTNYCVYINRTCNWSPYRSYYSWWFITNYCTCLG